MSENDAENRAKERLKESLSVTMDGQASELELRRVLADVSKQSSLRELAGRYQLIGDTLRGQRAEFADVDISKNVRAAIAQEKTPGFSSANESETTGRASLSKKSGSERVIHKLWSSLGKMAVAASVAGAVIIGVRHTNTDHDNLLVLNENEPQYLNRALQDSQKGNDYGVSHILAGNNPNHHDVDGMPDSPTSVRSSAEQSTKERFYTYALHHAELSAIGSGQTALLFARLASFDH